MTPNNANSKTAPRCWNRPALAPSHTRHGIDSQTGERISVEIDATWPTQGCVTWAGVGIGQPTPEYPHGTPYPIAHGWLPWCRHCIWMPKHDDIVP